MSTPTAALALTLSLAAACGSAEPRPAPAQNAITAQAPAAEPAAAATFEAAAAALAPQDPEPDTDAERAPEFDPTHAAWSALLTAHVRGGRVDYGAWKKSAEDREALATYLATLNGIDPENLGEWSDAERLAFWINAYNASVVDLIVGNYPLKSIEDLTTKKLAVWDRPLGRLGEHLADRGDGLSLNDIEHAIVRERFEDARIHAALNCAAESCPPLLDEAFRGEDLDEQLEAQMRAFVADATRNSLNSRKQRLELSRLFEWFAADFERDAGSVRAYVQRFAPGEDTTWIAKAKVSYRDYSWKLNDVER